MYQNICICLLYICVYFISEVTGEVRERERREKEVEVENGMWAVKIVKQNLYVVGRKK